MINASILLKNKEDEHLNVFWQYEGKPWLENNITKAFINTFDSLSINNKLTVLAELFNIDLDNTDNYRFQFFLQKESVPIEKAKEVVSEDNRILFAFSPTGKSWGYSGIDKNNKEQIEKAIEKHYLNSIDYIDRTETEKKEIIKKEISSVLDNIKEKGNPIPDGWIFIYNDKSDAPIYCIALENKLYDLDPFQINNHCQKALHVKNNIIVYRKYSDILECFNKLKNEFLASEFIRYMYLLKYLRVDTFAQISGMSDEYKAYYANKPCEETLRNIFKDGIDIRKRVKDGNCTKKSKLYRYNTGNDISPEVLMEFVADETSGGYLGVSLYFATTQSGGKQLYTCEPEPSYEIKCSHCTVYLATSIHFQTLGGTGNVLETITNRYVDKDGLKKYIQFWRQNPGFIKQSNTGERDTLLKKMENEKLLDGLESNKLSEYSKKYQSKKGNTNLNVVPEFFVSLRWDFETIVKLEKEKKLEKKIKEAIRSVYKAFGLDDLV